MYRIWGQWVSGFKEVSKGVETPSINIVFVTASATLKAQVSKAFRKLQVRQSPVGIYGAHESYRLLLNFVYKFPLPYML